MTMTMIQYAKQAMPARPLFTVIFKQKSDMAVSFLPARTETGAFAGIKVYCVKKGQQPFRLDPGFIRDIFRPQVVDDGKSLVLMVQPLKAPIILTEHKKVGTVAMYGFDGRLAPITGIFASATGPTSMSFTIKGRFRTSPTESESFSKTIECPSSFTMALYRKVMGF